MPLFSLTNLNLGTEILKSQIPSENKPVTGMFSAIVMYSWFVEKTGDFHESVIQCSIIKVKLFDEMRPMSL